MLQIDAVETISGVQVFGDSDSKHTFYVLPNQPRFRIDENGYPVFKFLKYRLPIDREDGKRGGGYIFFDSEFVVPEDKFEKIKETLQERVNKTYRKSRARKIPDVKIGTITYTKGTANLLLNDESGTLIQKVRGAGKPSLFGRNIAAFSLELTPEGSTVFEQALQGKGGVIQVVYDLYFWAKLPMLTVTGSFNSSKFYSFYQEIDTDWNVWSEDSYRETIREKLIENESMKLTIDPGGVTDEKLLSQIRDWAQRTLEDTAERKMIDSIAPVSEDDRKIPDGIEDVTRDIKNTKISNFHISYKEKSTVEWNLAPQGTLPNITSLTDKEGNPIVWDEYASIIDTDDPFFKTLNVTVQINADFNNLPIHSIETYINYPGTEPWEESFKSTDEVKKFASYVENDNWKYNYRYQVNYKNESKVFESEEIETDDKVLTVNVDDIGILTIDVLPGDINFQQVSQAQITLQYEDTAHGVDMIERQYTLDKNNPQHRFLEVIFEPRRAPYRYKVKYFMADGKEFQVDWKEGRSPQLYINDPFSAMKTIGIRAVGDLVEIIQTIYVDLNYEDKGNGYTKTKSLALSKDQPFFDWAFPVIDEAAGDVTYSGNITFRDGTTQEIPKKTTSESTILVGVKKVGYLEVEVIPDLVDFIEMVKLAKVSLKYEDAENDVTEREDIILKKGAVPTSWEVELKDKKKLEYDWKATFYMTDGSKRELDWTKTTEPSIVLEVPE